MCATKWIQGLPYSRGVKNFNIESLKKRSFYGCLFTKVHLTLELWTSCSLFIGLRKLGWRLEHMKHLWQTLKQNSKLPHGSCVGLHLKFELSFCGSQAKGILCFLWFATKFYVFDTIHHSSLTMSMATSHLVKLLSLWMKVCQIQIQNSQKLQVIV